MAKPKYFYCTVIENLTKTVSHNAILLTEDLVMATNEVEAQIEAYHDYLELLQKQQSEILKKLKFVYERKNC